MKNTGQLFSEIATYTLSGKITLNELNRTIYELFKKRRIELLSNEQLEKLSLELEKIHKKKVFSSK